jgi:hypothetical protein
VIKKNHSKKTSDSGLNSTDSKNFILNGILLLLTAVIIYLVYSLLMNIRAAVNEDSYDADLIQPSEIIQLEVLNGCGKDGIADRFTSYLRTINFDVVHTGNYRSFEVDHSLVIDRVGNVANAKKVAEALGINNNHIIQQLNKDYFLDVSVIIGKDFNNLIQKTIRSKIGAQRLYEKNQ